MVLKVICEAVKVLQKMKKEPKNTRIFIHPLTYKLLVTSAKCWKNNKNEPKRTPGKVWWINSKQNCCIWSEILTSSFLSTPFTSKTAEITCSWLTNSNCFLYFWGHKDNLIKMGWQLCWLHTRFVWSVFKIPRNSSRFVCIPVGWCFWTSWETAARDHPT